MIDRTRNSNPYPCYMSAERSVGAALFPPNGRARRASGEPIRFTGYRCGDTYALEPAPGAVKVMLGMDSRCWLFWDESGDTLVCRDRLAYGFSLADAVKVAWCWEVDPLSALQYSGSRVLEAFVSGDSCRLAPETAVWLPVRLLLADGVWHETSERGDVLFYRGARNLGLPWDVAVEYGWCDELSPL